MEFPFPVTKLFKDKVTKVRGDLVPEGFVEAGPFGRQCPQYVAQVVDAMGLASAGAQGLSRAVTSAERLRNSDHTLYVLTDHPNGSRNGRVLGFLKTGFKNLYLYDKHGHNHETKPLCILDFFIHNSLQRKGLGKELFDHMLRDMDVLPKHLALDRPSDSFMAFVRKHYGLFKTIPQVNNYAIYDDFFSKRPDGKSQYPSRLHGRVPLRGGKAAGIRRSGTAITLEPQRCNPQRASVQQQRGGRAPSQQRSPQQTQQQSQQQARQQAQQQAQQQVQQHAQQQAQEQQAQKEHQQQVHMMAAHEQMQAQQQMAQQQMQAQHQMAQMQMLAQQDLQAQQDSRMQGEMQAHQNKHAQHNVMAQQLLQAQQQAQAERLSYLQEGQLQQQAVQMQGAGVGQPKMPLPGRMWADAQGSSVGQCLTYALAGSPWGDRRGPAPGLTVVGGQVVPRPMAGPMGGPMAGPMAGPMGTPQQMVTAPDGSVMLLPPSPPPPGTAQPSAPGSPLASPLSSPMGAPMAGALVAGGDGCGVNPALANSAAGGSDVGVERPPSNLEAPGSPLAAGLPSSQSQAQAQAQAEAQAQAQAQDQALALDQTKPTAYELMRRSKYSHTPLW